MSSSSGDEEKLEFAPHLREAWELALTHKKFIVVVTICVAALVTILHFAYPSHSATSYLIIDTPSETSNLQGLLASMGGGSLERGSFNDSEDAKFLMSLNSTSFARRFAKEVAQDPQYPQMHESLRKPTGPMPQLRTLLRGLSHRETPEEAAMPPSQLRPRKATIKRKGVFEFEFRTPSPALTVFLTNKYLDVSSQLFLEREARKVERAREYIQNKIKETMGKLEETDKTILGVNQNTANVSLMASRTAIAEQLLKLREELQGAQFKFDQNTKVIESLRAGKEGPVVENSLFGVKRTISNLESENKILEIRIGTLKKGLDDYLKFNRLLPKEEAKLSDLNRQKGVDFFVLENLFKTMVNIEVQGLAGLNRIYPLEKLTLEEVTRSFGLFSKWLLAIFAGLLGSWAGLYGRHLISPVIRTRKDFEAPSVTFLANVPRIDDEYFTRFRSEYPSLCHFQIESKETNAFRHMRSRLMHLSSTSGDKPRRVISFLSYGSGEGKSFLSSNLGACIAHAGKRTLLVDFDVRRALLTRSFKFGDAPGLCEHLDKGIPLTDVIKERVLPNLDILPAGKPSQLTTEQFSNQRFQQMMKDLSHYDFIVIDTAPLLVAHESLAIAQDSDFAIVTATSWQTKKEDLTEAIERIRNVRKTHTHFVINKTKEIKDSTVKNYYYYFGAKTRSRLAAKQELLTST